MGGARKNFPERVVGRFSVYRGSSGQPGSHVPCPGLCPGTEALYDTGPGPLPSSILTLEIPLTNFLLA